MKRKMVFMSKKIACSLMLFLGFLFIMPSMGHSEEALAENNIRQVKKIVNIRENRTIMSKIVGKFYPKQNFRVGFLDKKWYAAFKMNQTADNEADAIGYIYAPLLAPLPQDSNRFVSGEGGASEQVWTMIADRVINIRKDRTTKSNKTGRLYAGTKVKASFFKNDWCAVFNFEETTINEANALGYVYAPLLIKEPQAKLEMDQIESISDAAPEETQEMAGQETLTEEPMVEEAMVEEAMAEEPMAEEAMAEEAMAEEAMAEKNTLMEKSYFEWANVRYASKKIDIKKDRSSESQTAGFLEVGDRVKVAFLKNGWHAIFNENAAATNEANAIGYVYSPFLTPVALPLEALKRGEIKYVAKKVNIRRLPNKESEIVGVLLPDTKVKAGLLKDDWYAIFDINEISFEPENAFGYVYATFLNPIAAPYMAAKEEPPLTFGDECILQDCSIVIDEGGKFLLSNATVADEKKWVVGATLNVGLALGTYETTKSIGDSSGIPLGISSFLSYDNWMLELSYEKKNMDIDFVRQLNGKNTKYKSEQDSTEIAWTARYLLRPFSLVHFTPYIIGGMTLVSLDETRDGNVTIKKDPKTDYVITRIGAGGIMPINEKLGLRGDITGLMLSSNNANDDAENSLIDSAFGFSALIAGYWQMCENWNVEAGLIYSYIKEKEGFQHPHYTTGGSVGTMKELEYFLKLGYSYRF